MTGMPASWADCTGVAPASASIGTKIIASYFWVIIVLIWSCWVSASYLPSKTVTSTSPPLTAGCSFRAADQICMNSAFRPYTAAPIFTFSAMAGEAKSAAVETIANIMPLSFMSVSCARRGFPLAANRTPHACAASLSSGSVAPISSLIEHHGADDQHALQHLLVVGFDSHEIEAVVHDPDDQRANQRSVYDVDTSL